MGRLPTSGMLRARKMKNANPKPMLRGRSGFSLAEVMVASTILIVFGLMAVGTLRYGTQLWRSGHRRSTAYDTATIAFQQLQDDLGAAKNQFWGQDADAFDTRVKFWVDFDQRGRQRLRFVRGIPDDAVNPRLRQAGDGVDNDNDSGGEIDEEIYNLRDDDDDGLIDEDLMPLEGMCEVAYLMGRAGGRRTLYRAVLSPIGQDLDIDEAGCSLFSNAHIDDADDSDAQDKIVGNTAAGWPGVALPLAENVLYMGIWCRSQYTSVDWENSPRDFWWPTIDPDRTLWDPTEDFQKWVNSYTRDDCAPVPTWDSDRINGDLDRDFTDWPTPPFAMDWGTVYWDSVPWLSGVTTNYYPDTNSDFDTEDNGEDEDYVRDNVFPRSLMMVLVVEPPEKMRDPNPLRLRSNVPASGAVDIEVAGAQPVLNPEWPYLLIEDDAGDEWMRYDRYEVDPQGGYFVVPPEGRGQRGTAADTHDTGDLVKIGTTFSRVFDNPAGRDYWGQ